jgi:hypothetical protein
VVEKTYEEKPEWGIKHIKGYLDTIPEDVKKQLSLEV